MRYSELCEQYSEDAVDAFVGWGSEDLEHFEDCYCGEHNSEEDLLEHRTDGTDAFDTLYIGCEKFPFRETFLINVSGVL